MPENVTFDDLVPNGEPVFDDLVPQGPVSPRTFLGFEKGPMSFAGQAGEGVVNVLSGIPGSFAAGIGGALALQDGPDAAAQAIRDIQAESPTLIPAETTGGQMTAEMLQKPFEWFEKGADFLGEGARRLTGSPGVATAVKTGILAPAAALGLKRSGPVSTPKTRIAQEAQAQGYVAPPGSAGGGTGVKVTEGLVGQARLQQAASFKNQPVTNRLAAQSLKLDPDTVLTPEFLSTKRAEWGQSYAVLNDAGPMFIDSPARLAIRSAVKDLRAASRDFPALKRAEAGVDDAIAISRDITNRTLARTVDSASVNGAIRVLRDLADSAFVSKQKSLGRAYRDISKALENAADRHLSSLGNADAIAQFREARTLIARSYDVQKALRNADVDAHTIRGLRRKDKPLGPELDLIARFAEEFPQSSRLLKEGTRPTTVVDALVALGFGGGGLATGNPFVALPALGVAARPVIRSGLLSRPGQRLANPRTTHPLLAPSLAASSEIVEQGTE